MIGSDHPDFLAALDAAIGWLDEMGETEWVEVLRRARRTMDGLHELRRRVRSRDGLDRKVRQNWSAISEALTLCDDIAGHLERHGDAQGQQLGQVLKRALDRFRDPSSLH